MGTSRPTGGRDASRPLDGRDASGPLRDPREGPLNSFGTSRPINGREVPIFPIFSNQQPFLEFF
jgi:hypothetical protein